MHGTVEERFWAKVNKTDGCWLWTGSLTNKGYGSFSYKGHTVQSHRYAHELLVGLVPEGLEVDHLCRNRACMNPAHLEAVTHRVNLLRGNSFSARYARVTHCPQGHLYNEANTRLSHGRRLCRTCRNKASRTYKQQHQGVPNA